MQTPDPVVFKYAFADLPVKTGWIEKLMGYAEGESPDPIAGMIDEIFTEAPAHTDIRGGYVVPVQFEILDKSHIKVNFLDFYPGKIITGSLRKSEKIAFFLMTAGKGIEAWSRERIRNGDTLAGYIIDLLGSEIVESAVDLMQVELEKEMEREGYHITNPYSPGYCGWLVKEQQKLFTFFPENFCGISLSESSLMIPIKSVSGITGIGRDVKKTAYSCKICDVQNCVYRDRKVLT